MKIFRVVVVASALWGGVSVADISPLTAEAANEPAKSGVTSPAQGEQVSATPLKKVGAVVPKKKRKKKKPLIKSRTVLTEPPAAPREAVSGSQNITREELFALLKTNRDLSGKSLKGLNLVGVDLSKCNLKGADLTNADLERADLGESDLERANLAGANLRMASLKLAGMIGANLENAILDGAIWQDGRICAKGSLGECREKSSARPAR